MREWVAQGAAGMHRVGQGKRRVVQGLGPPAHPPEGAWLQCRLSGLPGAAVPSAGSALPQSAWSVRGRMIRA